MEGDEDARRPHSDDRAESRHVTESGADFGLGVLQRGTGTSVLSPNRALEEYKKVMCVGGGAAGSDPSWNIPLLRLTLTSRNKIKMMHKLAVAVTVLVTALASFGVYPRQLRVMVGDAHPVFPGAAAGPPSGSGGVETVTTTLTLTLNPGGTSTPIPSGTDTGTGVPSSTDTGSPSATESGSPSGTDTGVPSASATDTGSVPPSGTAVSSTGDSTSASASATLVGPSSLI